MDIAVQRIAEQLNPIDDLMFRKMAEDTGFCQEVLQTILGDGELVVIDGAPIPQLAAASVRGRPAVLDAHCILKGGRRMDIEVQRSSGEEFQRRVRYYASLITAGATEPGAPFGDVPDVCVIYIAKFDPFESGMPLYHVDRVVRETGARKYNGFNEVYVDAMRRDGSAISRLMRVFVEPDVYDFAEFPQTSRCKQLFKETEEGKAIMCEIVEEYAQSVARDAAERAAAMALDKGRRDALRSLVADGLISADVAAARLGTSVEDLCGPMGPGAPAAEVAMGG